MQSLGTRGRGETSSCKGKLAMAIGDFAQINALEEAGIDYGVATLPVEKAGDPPYLPDLDRRLGRLHRQRAPDGGDGVHRLPRPPTVSACASKSPATPPLSAAAAAEFGWAEQGNVEAPQAVSGGDRRAPSRPMFIPGFWDVVAPLQDVFNLVAEGR